MIKTNEAHQVRASQNAIPQPDLVSERKYTGFQVHGKELDMRFGKPLYSSTDFNVKTYRPDHLVVYIDQETGILTTDVFRFEKWMKSKQEENK